MRHISCVAPRIIYFGIIDYTAKKVIGGNRLSRLKIASLLMKNILRSIGIFLSTHRDSKNSQDHAQKLQRNCTFMNLASDC